MENDSLSVRVPEEGEGRLIAQVQNTAWSQAYGDLLPGRFYDDAALAARTQMWEQVLSGQGGRRHVRVALIRGRLVGFASTGPIRDDDVSRLGGKRSEQLHTLYVLAEHHGRGVGDALLEAVLEGAPSCLWVLEENLRARRFYARHGFVPDGAVEDLADEELRGITEIRMIR